MTLQAQENAPAQPRKRVAFVALTFDGDKSLSREKFLALPLETQRYRLLRHIKDKYFELKALGFDDVVFVTPESALQGNFENGRLLKAEKNRLTDAFKAAITGENWHLIVNLRYVNLFLAGQQIDPNKITRLKGAFDDQPDERFRGDQNSTFGLKELDADVYNLNAPSPPILPNDTSFNGNVSFVFNPGGKKRRKQRKTIPYLGESYDCYSPLTPPPFVQKSYKGYFKPAQTTSIIPITDKNGTKITTVAIEICADALKNVATINIKDLPDVGILQSDTIPTDNIDAIARNAWGRICTLMVDSKKPNAIVINDIAHYPPSGPEIAFLEAFLPDPDLIDSLQQTRLEATQLRCFVLSEVYKAFLNLPQTATVEEILVEAANRNCIPIIKMLLLSGINVNAKNSLGKTAFMIADYRKREDEQIIFTLLAYGKNVDIANSTLLNDLETLGFDILFTSPLFSRFLRNMSIGNRTLLTFAAEKGDIQAVEKLISNFGFDPNENDQFFLTPITAVLNSTIDEDLMMAIIKKLLEHGADINMKDKKGLTPLITAISLNKPPRVIEFLLANGANVNEKAQGKTPLMAAQKTSSKIEFIPLLLSYGQEIDISGSRLLKVIQEYGLNFLSQNPIYGPHMAKLTVGDTPILTLFAAAPKKESTSTTALVAASMTKEVLSVGREEQQTTKPDETTQLCEVGRVVYP